jgi:hypothetical protein
VTLSARARSNSVERLRRRGLSRALAEDLWYHGTDAMILDALKLSDEGLAELNRLDAVRRGKNQVAMSARRRAEIRWGV